LPFFHGALRHLDDAYLENDSDHVKPGALIVDFALLFLHAMAFVVLALLLENPNHFGLLLLALILVDVFWGAFVYFAASSRTDHAAEGRWTLINLCFILLGVGYFLKCRIWLGPVEDKIFLSFVIFAGCFLRSLIDYVWCWRFYFPNEE
jgi:hypothetical protein